MAGLGVGIYANSNSNPPYQLFDPVFDGTYYLENSSPSGLPTGGSQMTMTAWAKVTQPTDAAQVIFGFGSNSDDSQQVEFIYNAAYRQLEFYWNQGWNPTGWMGDSSYVLAPNQWYFIAVTYDGGITLKLYVGVNERITNQQEENNLDTAGDRIRCGLGVHHFADFSNLFTGNIERVGIWDRCLSADEISALYAEGRRLYGDLPEDVLKELEGISSDAECKEITTGALQAFSDISTVGWWKLNDDAESAVNDSSGLGYNGTVNGTGIYTNDVPYSGLNYSLTFNGESNVVIPNEAIFNQLPLSVSVWIKTTQTNGGVGIVNKYTSSSLNGWQVFLDGGTVYAWYFGGNESNSVYGPIDGSPVADGNWHFITFTVGNDGGKLYVDSNLAGSLGWTGSPTPTTTNDNITLGQYDVTYNGEMSDARIYNAELNQDQINQLFAGNNPTGDALGYITTSSGDFLDTSTNSEADIYCSDGSHLEFGTNEVVGAGPVSFWNLIESSGTRYDSVGDNDLNEVGVSASFSYTTPSQTGTPVSFTDTSVLADSWSWIFGDGGTSTEQNPTYTYEIAGDYTVTLTINGGGHGAWSCNNSIEIENSSASFTDSPNYAGLATNFADTSLFPNGSWSWTFGDGGTSTEQNPTYVYEVPGTYTVSLTISDGASSTSSSITIEAATSPIWLGVDLSSYFNTIGMIPEGYAGESNSGLDGGAAQNSPPGSAGVANGVDETAFYTHYSNPINVNGVNFTFPSGNSENTIYCNGQVITLAGGNFDYIYMLGFGTDGGTAGGYADFVVTYSDSSADTIQLKFSDWFNNSNGYENETVALGGSGNLLRSDESGPIYIFEYTLAIDRTKQAVSLTLPVYMNLDIFAITQASIVSQPSMWMTADYLKWTLNNGDNVSSWTDISGLGNNLTQSNESLLPVYRTNVINGLPAVHCYGSNNISNVYTNGQYLTGNISLTSDYSVMTVMARSDGSDSCEQVATSIGTGEGGNTFWNGYENASASVSQEYNALVVGSDSHNDLYNPIAISEQKFHICEARYSQANGYMEGWDGDFANVGNPVVASNNPSENNNVTSGSLSSGNVTIGAYGNQSLFFNGYVAEVLLWNLSLNDSDRAVIESYLVCKYNLAAQNEIQQFSFSESPSSGTYTITANSHTTAPIPYDADASEIQTALELVLGSGTTNVSQE